MDTPCICTVFMPITAKPKLYNPRHPERTLLYQTVAECVFRTNVTGDFGIVTEDSGPS